MKFTWLDKYTEVLESVPDEDARARLALAIVEYGSDGREPSLEWPLSSIFLGLRDDLDYSRAAHESGKRGGRPRKAQAKTVGEDSTETPLEETEKTEKGSENPPLETLFEETEKTENGSQTQGKARQCNATQQDDLPYEVIVDALNEACGTHFKATTPKTRSLIRARWGEGFREDDFNKVFRRKAGDWRGTEMERYLRPETLLGTKFEGYLNEKGGGGDGRFDEYDL